MGCRIYAGNMAIRLMVIELSDLSVAGCGQYGVILELDQNVINPLCVECCGWMQAVLSNPFRVRCDLKAVGCDVHKDDAEFGSNFRHHTIVGSHC